MESLKVGMTYESKKIVTKDQTASAYGSGSLYVFATPAMIGLMENAALNCVDGELGDEYSTVGIYLDIKHIAATKLDMEVRAIAELIEIDGKKLKFKVEAFDEDKKIGEGMHSRFIINKEEFMEKVNS